MSFPNVRASDKIALLTELDPVSQAAGTVTTGWVDAGAYAEILAYLKVGALGSSATVDAKLRQATDSTGTGAKDITGKAITQLTQAGSQSNSQVLINCMASELDVANSFRYVELSITVGTAACLISADIFGVDARYAPAAQPTSVVQVV